ncbi:hypothetical protein SCOR_13745 [Sulfidibacter corallicola]|uniref:Uncharacterized protein n=1 Tax=Sulfidibacter corallicola TaxID=2818388 RepID=A0A8A4TBX9_SULCO|nr:hypothetical protein [Sulfidibacter corallicola]QTD47619.1 hypothetical protein J3U87_18665 [Sulfidibacter corallicola]
MTNASKLEVCAPESLELIFFDEDDFENWDPERLLETDAVFLLRDVARILAFDFESWAARVEAFTEPEKVGLVKVWGHWFVKMAEFHTWYANGGLGFSQKLVS